MFDVSWIDKFKGLSHLFSLFTSCSALRLSGNSISRLLIHLVSSLGNDFSVSSLVVCESSVSGNEVFCLYVVGLKQYSKS